MTRAMIKLDLTIPKLDEIFKKHERDIMGVMAATMQTNRSMMFDKDGADNGKKKWADPVFRQGRPLQDSGELRKSWAPTNNGRKPGHSPNGILRIMNNEVQIGTTLYYARLMNDGTAHMSGGVMRPTNAQALMIPMPSGKKATDAAAGMKTKTVQNSLGEEQNVIFRKSVRIPGRSMDEITEQDATEFSETLANYISEVLSAGD